MRHYIIQNYPRGHSSPNHWPNRPAIIITDGPPPPIPVYNASPPRPHRLIRRPSWTTRPADQKPKDEPTLTIYTRDEGGKTYHAFTLPTRLLHTSAYLLPRLTHHSTILPFPCSKPTFEFYESWLLHSHRLSPPPPPPPPPHSPTSYKFYHALLDAYALALSLRDPTFQDHLASTLLSTLRLEPAASRRAPALKKPNPHPPRFVDCLHDTHLLKRLYARSDPTAPIRRLLVDAAVRFAATQDFDEFAWGAEYPCAFLGGLVRGLQRERERLGKGGGRRVRFAEGGAEGGYHCGRDRGEERFGVDECVYHEHRREGRRCWRDDVG
ncbi:hypothetical protein BS50DRAFT_668813 [Corynespora cassiicola Philippines]|uniref:BTB domain-containing protein n=1 Tax=Corynespora cassiicola Philippines TaxID=1448308 RepID=A0A2T2NL28_CORCC|nr:hypothetical protein BS50DRAFT_668813 [Corynespora cassiicola Philippines]